jgi:hypothetical protein
MRRRNSPSASCRSTSGLSPRMHSSSTADWNTRSRNSRSACCRSPGGPWMQVCDRSHWYSMELGMQLRMHACSKLRYPSLCRRAFTWRNRNPIPAHQDSGVCVLLYHHSATAAEDVITNAISVLSVGTRNRWLLPFAFASGLMPGINVLSWHLLIAVVQDCII